MTWCMDAWRVDSCGRLWSASVIHEIGQWNSRWFSFECLTSCGLTLTLALVYAHFRGPTRLHASCKSVGRWRRERKMASDVQRCMGALISAVLLAFLAGTSADAQ